MKSINWTHAEKESLIRVARQIQATNPHLDNRELLAAAMEQVLSDDRRRDADRVNGGNFDWFLEALGMVRRTNKVVWDREEKAALVEEAARIRSEGTVLREVELLKKAMVVLSPDRKRNVNSMAGTSWAWFREGVAVATKKALARGIKSPAVEPVGRSGEGVAGESEQFRERVGSDQAVGHVGESFFLVRLVMDLEDRLSRLERDLYGEGSRSTEVDPIG